jgi:hypothetical protein
MPSEQLMHVWVAVQLGLVPVVHCASATHWTQAPEPSQKPVLHVVPDGAFDWVGPGAHAGTMHGSVLTGGSVGSGTRTVAPWPSHWGLLQSPGV